MPTRKLRKSYSPGRGYTQADWDEVSNNPPLTDAEIAQARPFAEVFPDLSASIRRNASDSAPADK